MTEPGFPTLLAHPGSAIALAAFIMGLAALALVRAGRAAPAAYWPRLTLLSEVLLALGLLGLMVFAGRLTLAADQLTRETRVRLAQAQVDVRMREAVTAQCSAAGMPTTPPPPSRPARSTSATTPNPANLTPYNPGLAANELCTLARATPALGASVFAWQSAAHALRQFDARYPGCVDNVFSRHNDCAATLAQARALTAAIDAVAVATQAADEQAQAHIAVSTDDSKGQGETDWGFAVLAAFLAGAGMTIRVARAAARLAGPDNLAAR